MILTLRRRFSDGMQFDINYTLSKSEDMGSQVERGSSFGNFSNGGYTGFLINSFDPELNYGTSDFDVRHQINVNGIWDLPFGQGKRYGRQRRGLREPADRRLVDRRAGALDQRLPVQRRRTAAPAGRRTGTCRATPVLVDAGRLPETETSRERGGRSAEPVRRIRRRR